ncbi:MAG: hypothetical protein H0T76_03045 [Nannocystis sp.]|nr:hypothetical protein [Nannocystis sp.]MBA3545438.1 hypothetical protein [Nannocystis sp.]
MRRAALLRATVVVAVFAACGDEVAMPEGQAWSHTKDEVASVHSYHVANVEEDGNVPVTEQDHWRQPDSHSFRQGPKL